MPGEGRFGEGKLISTTRTSSETDFSFQAASPEPGARQHHTRGVREVIPPGVTIDGRSATEVAHPDDHRSVEQAAMGQVGDECSHPLVEIGKSLSVHAPRDSTREVVLVRESRSAARQSGYNRAVKVIAAAILAKLVEFANP